MSIRFAPVTPTKTKAKVEAEKLSMLANMPEKQFQAELVRARGRPQTTNETVTLRVDSETLAFFKTYGDQWKPEMVAALRKAAGL